ncbi:4-hydroxy-tetrahydrodipicolinate reductase [Rapidithrix thailandica]|uniref:4-hydroxy-tetrahydrodipicolinate reductase n=1 Tax=Rapidithrix thailandica TaxID=413964 RepID=A0AAW9SIL0_9BACT
MNILLIGYGKMGKTIEGIAKDRGHQVPVVIDVENPLTEQSIKNQSIDVAIEFTSPEAAFENIKFCVEHNIPVVSGTTGWLDRKAEIEALCDKHKSAFFYASNYSLGVNLFFKLNEYLAKMINHYPEYSVSMEEIHHIQKKDAPSGTAITLAEGIIQEIQRKNGWVLKGEQEAAQEQFAIEAKRIENVPGTHTVTYESEIDSIEIKHTAHSRQGFALGAVVAAEWLKDKQGAFGMNDILKF